MLVIDFIFFGVGIIVGIGLYVIIGILVCNVLGLLVVLLFFLVFNVVFLCGFLFVEYGSCFFDGGFLYMYIYVMLGEILVFVVGWNIVLEFLFNGVSLVWMCSVFINYVINGILFVFFLKYLDWSIFGSVYFFDFFVVVIVFVVMIILCLGVCYLVNFYNVVIIVNLVVIVFMIFVGFFYVYFKYWEMNFVFYGFFGVLLGVV